MYSLYGIKKYDTEDIESDCKLYEYKVSTTQWIHYLNELNILEN